MIQQWDYGVIIEHMLEKAESLENTQNLILNINREKSNLFPILMPNNKKTLYCK